MEKGRAVFNLITIGLLSVGAVCIQNVSAEEYKTKANSVLLVQEDLPGVTGHQIIIKHFEFPAGYVGGRHSHSGPVYVYVEEGEITVDVDGEKQQRLQAGSLYQEPIGRVMQASNLSTTEPTKIVVFQVSEKDKPMMIKAE